MQRNFDSRSGTGGGRSSGNRMTIEQLKSLQERTGKNKNMKGEVIQCDKGMLSILVFDRYYIEGDKQVLKGPECTVLKYCVDDDLKERFPLKAMLQKGTKVVVNGPLVGFNCEKKSLRLDVEASSADEEPPGAKSEKLEPEETKKSRKKSSKSPSCEKDKDRVVRNVAARVLEVSKKDVVLCFQPEGHGDKEPIRLQNDLELDITLYGRKSPQVFKIEDVKDKFVVGDRLKMNARKKNNVWHVQELIWPNWKDSKECETIPLTPIPEEPNREVDTVDNVEPLRKETSDLLQQFVSTDLVDAVLASTENSASIEMKEALVGDQDEISGEKVNEDQTILEEPIDIDGKEEILPVDGAELVGDQDKISGEKVNEEQTILEEPIDIDGKEEILPVDGANSNEETSSAPLAVTANNSSDFVEYRALYDYSSESALVLVLKAGDIIIVNPDQPHESGWLWGELNGKVGWFPEAYAEPASNPVKVAAEEAIAVGDGVKDNDTNLYVALSPYTSEGEKNVEIVDVNKETEMKSNDKEVVVAPKEDLTINSQPAEVTVTKNITEENQDVDQMNVVVDEAVTKPEEPIVLIKPDAFTMTKLDDQPALVSDMKNDVIEDPANIVFDEAIAKLAKAIVLLKSDSFKAKGCKKCVGYMKSIVAKKATELHDAVPEQVWNDAVPEQVWKELSGKFN